MCFFLGGVGGETYILIKSISKRDKKNQKNLPPKVWGPRFFLEKKKYTSEPSGNQWFSIPLRIHGTNGIFTLHLSYKFIFMVNVGINEVW